MIRPETLKILLVLTLYQNWVIRQWDVVAASLQADLHYDINVSDINEKEEIEYWKLNKALHELKQAGHRWYKTLEKLLEITGLKQCIGNEGTYISENRDIIIGTHVDHLVGIAPQDKDLYSIEASCEKSVELDKRGKPLRLLRMELTWKKDEVILTQKTLIETMQQTHLPNISDQIGNKTSLPSNMMNYEPMAEDEGDEPIEQKPCQSLIGGLLFVGRMTRPEISLYINLLG